MNKKELLYRGLTLIVMIGLGGFLFQVAFSGTPYNLLSYDYFVAHGFEETGAKNLLTGIYLNYRLFDTVFESTLLFVVTAGILYLGKKDSDVR